MFHKGWIINLNNHLTESSGESLESAPAEHPFATGNKEPDPS